MNSEEDTELNDPGSLDFDESTSSLRPEAKSEINQNVMDNELNYKNPPTEPSSDTSPTDKSDIFFSPECPAKDDPTKHEEDSSDGEKEEDQSSNSIKTINSIYFSMNNCDTSRKTSPHPDSFDEFHSIEEDKHDLISQMHENKKETQISEQVLHERLDMVNSGEGSAVEVISASLDTKNSVDKLNDEELASGSSNDHSIKENVSFNQMDRFSSNNENISEQKEPSPILSDMQDELSRTGSLPKQPTESDEAITEDSVLDENEKTFIEKELDDIIDVPTIHDEISAQDESIPVRNPLGQINDDQNAFTDDIEQNSLSDSKVGIETSFEGIEDAGKSDEGEIVSEEDDFGDFTEAPVDKESQKLEKTQNDLINSFDNFPPRPELEHLDVELENLLAGIPNPEKLKASIDCLMTKCFPNSRIESISDSDKKLDADIKSEKDIKSEDWNSLFLDIKHDFEKRQKNKKPITCTQSSLRKLICRSLRVPLNLDSNTEMHLSRRSSLSNS